MIWLGKKSWVWAVDKPEDLDFEKFKGRFVKVLDDHKRERVVEIESVMGCIAPQHKTKLQVNSGNECFVISALDFFAQMNGEYIPKEQIELFDETQFAIQENKSRYKNWGKKLWTPK